MHSRQSRAVAKGTTTTTAFQVFRNGKSMASVVLGLLSFVTGWTIVVPAIGLIVGLLGFRNELASRKMAVVGLILNALLFVGWGLDLDPRYAHSP